MKIVIALITFLSLSFAHAADSKYFDLKAIADLSDQADDVWAKLVREKGSRERAVQAIKAKNEPSVRLVHENLLQLIESSQFDNAGAWLEYFGSYGPEYKREIGRPMSPVLRMAARNIAIVSALALRKKIESYSTLVPTNLLMDKLYQGSLKPCADNLQTLNPTKRIPPFTAEMKRLGRIYFYASKISTADYQGSDDFSCANYLDYRWALASLNALIKSELQQGTMAVENEKHPIKFECLKAYEEGDDVSIEIESAGFFRRLVDPFIRMKPVFRNPKSVEAAEDIAFEYLKIFRKSL
jgi:hypothetical protein